MIILSECQLLCKRQQLLTVGKPSSKVANTSICQNDKFLKMPSVADKQPSLESLQSHFPLTYPVPNPVSHPHLISVKDLHREEDLLRNPSSFRTWWSAINAVREEFIAQQKLERSVEIPPELSSLLGPLATPLARNALQRLTYLYEAALVNFGGSFKLWKSYLSLRMSFVLGKPVVKKRAGGKKKLPEMKDALQDEKEDIEEWEGGLDGVVGWEEWKSLLATFERALMYLPKVRLQVNSYESPETLPSFVSCSYRVYG